MKIIDGLSEKRVSFSFEFFPPKTEKGVENLYNTVSQLKRIDPSFVSVTYGAGGGTRDKTIDIATHIKKTFGIEVMAHLTCVGSDREDILNILDELKSKGINNILALRGDLPAGSEKFEPPANGFAHASELVEFIKRSGDFSVAVAGYPEGHIEAPDKETDFSFLKQKVDSGAEFVVTQLFFDNRYFFDFTGYMRKIGVTVPIVPGILPLTNFNKLDKILEMSNATFPADIADKFNKIKDDPEAVKQLGIEYASKQVKGLISGGVTSIHFYTFNTADTVLAIIENLKQDKVI